MWKERLRWYSKQAPLSAHWEPNYTGNWERWGWFSMKKVHQHELTQRVIKKHHWTHTSASQNSKYSFSTVWKEPLRRYSKQAPLSAHWEPNYVGNPEEERSGRFSRKKGPPTVVKKRSSRKAVCEPLLSRIFFWVYSCLYYRLFLKRVTLNYFVDETKIQQLIGYLIYVVYMFKLFLFTTWLHRWNVPVLLLCIVSL